MYVLYGADSVAAEELVRRLKDKLIAPGLEAFDFESLHAEDTPVVTALQHARQPAVGSQRRMVVIRNADQLHKKQFAELCDGLKRFAGTTQAQAQTRAAPATVVVTCAEDRDLAAALASAGLNRYVVDLRQPGAADLAAMLGRWAAERQLALEPAAARMLVELCGEDTAVLHSETEKLAAAVEPGTKVTPEMVRRYAARSRDFVLNEYVGHLVRGETSAALVVLERLSVWGEEPLKIVNWLANNLLWSAPGAGRAADYRRRCLQQLYEINRAVITGHPEPFVLLQAFTVCFACNDTPEYCRLVRETDRPELCIRRDRRAAKRRVHA